MKKNVRDYKVNGKQFAYILDSIHSEDVDVSKMSDKERIEYALGRFYREKAKEDNSRRNMVGLIEDWLQGLCSTVRIAYDYESIVKIGKSWGYCETDKKAEKFVDNWYHSIAVKMFLLAKKLEVDVMKYR